MTQDLAIYNDAPHGVYGERITAEDSAMGARGRWVIVSHAKDGAQALEPYTCAEEAALVGLEGPYVMVPPTQLVWWGSHELIRLQDGPAGRVWSCRGSVTPYDRSQVWPFSEIGDTQVGVCSMPWWEDPPVGWVRG